MTSGRRPSKRRHPLIEDLIQARHDQGLTQLELSEHVVSVGLHESGHRIPTLHTLDTWAYALGLRLTLAPTRLSRRSRAVNDREIARIADTAAAFFDRNSIVWREPRDPSRTFVPSAADIALTIHRLAGQVRPGGRAESGHLVVDWPPPDESGRPEKVQVWIHLGDLIAETRK